MFAKRIVPLVFVVAVLTGGTASAQSRKAVRPGGQTFVAPRHVPPTFAHPKPFVQPQIVAKPAFVPQKSFIVPPVGHHHHGNHHAHHHHGHHHHHHAHFPPFWGGTWGYPTYPVARFPIVGLPGVWFVW